MRLISLYFIMQGFVLISFSQKNGSYQVALSNYVYTKTEEEPQFKGGAGEWIRFITRNMVLPDSCNVYEIQSTVVVRCIVFKTGKVGNVEIIRGGGDCCNKNFIRLVELSNNKWIPALVKGKFVNCYKKIPITICLREG